jgi:riboflavin synthase
VFTGIVEDLGEVEAVDQQGDFARIYVRSSVVTSDARIGDSICVSGVCLTVTGLLGGSPPSGFTADVMGETLRFSSLKSLSPGTQVNLERSVRLEDRLGGHLVQGHTDGTGTIQSRVSHRDWDVVRISLPADLVSGIDDDWFEVSLIPETLKRTTLGSKQPGDEVNLEVDVIAKYVEKLTGGTR